jgi:hypothetical protein
MLRIAIIGAGPSGFFLADRLLSQEAVPVSVDLFERLPSPYGLVRYGVAPDHEKIRNVTRSFDKVAARPGFRFFGNVEVGRHVSLEELRHHYHLIAFTTGAQTDRRMASPEKTCTGSHTATGVRRSYNGHRLLRLLVRPGAERVAVVGVETRRGRRADLAAPTTSWRRPTSPTTRSRPWQSRVREVSAGPAGTGPGRLHQSEVKAGRNGRRGCQRKGGRSHPDPVSARRSRREADAHDAEEAPTFCRLRAAGADQQAADAAAQVPGVARGDPLRAERRAGESSWRANGRAAGDDVKPSHR